MNIVLSFIGKCPKYIIDSVHQIRCFTNSSIYLIMDDIQSPFISSLLKYNVNIIDYNDVVDKHFLTVVNNNFNKFLIIHDLNERSHLFIRAFERFFLLHNLMKINSLENCFFMEVDNLIYDDPNKWLENFSKNDLCYMYDNTDHYSSGIMYIKQSDSLTQLLNYFINYITTSNEFMSEMTCLSRYYETQTNNIQLLPIYWKDENICDRAYNNFDIYNNSIFDAAAIGIFLLGEHPFHNNGQLILGKKHTHSAVDYTEQLFKWEKDEHGRNKPYIWNDSSEKWLLINNLHVQSKELHAGLSLPLEL